MPETIPGPSFQPRIIIHGGAGNISRSNLPPKRQQAYRQSMISILTYANAMLAKGATALDTATHAVTMFELDPLFNCSRGAVFTRDGTIELEASIMVSRGYRKQGVGCMLLKRVKHPIQLAKEMLVRGEAGDGKGGGAYGHAQLSGERLEELAEDWGLEMVEQEWFWTRRRWEEHRKGLEREKRANGVQNDALGSHSKPEEKQPHFNGEDPSWDGKEYLPQGTVGAVVLDRYGTLCVATSTGGMTNKLAGRIGDTPTLGAGFWAEQWNEDASSEPRMQRSSIADPVDVVLRNLGPVAICLPWLSRALSVSSGYAPIQKDTSLSDSCSQAQRMHAVAMSGTGNGDSFLRTAAARTAAAMTRFSRPPVPLVEAVRRVAGPGGELQQSAGDRWGKTGEGEGGIIGIELANGKGSVVWDFNCGGMFRAWIDGKGKPHWAVFEEE